MALFSGRSSTLKNPTNLHINGASYHWARFQDLQISNPVTEIKRNLSGPFYKDWT